MKLLTGLQKVNYVLASAPTGGAFKNWILQLGGNVLIAAMVIFLITGFARQSIGRIAGVLILGAFCAWFLNSPESFLGVLRGVAELFGQ
ncbi:TcpD family membrane protein [Enterococcus sp. AZ103]|uniref:TcpD family membrane protein n=1 Tax=Enterococcus sp. AZ103 TaxID=2774628 RepID=UPI003F24E44F